MIADTIELDRGRAIAAIRKMGERFASPSLTTDYLLLRMDTAGLPEIVGVVGPVASEMLVGPNRQVVGYARVLH